MGVATQRDDDPVSLSPLGFIKRAARLPVRDLLQRVARISLSLPRNLMGIGYLVGRLKRKGKTARFILLTGRMGDLIAAEPVIRHIKQPGDYIVWLCRPRYADVLRFNPYVDEIRLVSSDLEADLIKRFFSRQRWVNLLPDETRCNIFGTKLNNPNHAGIKAQNRYMFGSNADIFALLGTGQKLNQRPHLYVDTNFDANLYIKTIFRNDRPFLVFHPLSDEFSRSWEKHKAQEFAAWILESTSLNLIEVGMSPVLQSGPRVFNMMDKLLIPCQMAVIARAMLFVGVDSAFSHIANSSAVPSVLLVGTHLGFDAQLPLLVHESDVVVRGPGQTHEIEVADVSEAVSCFIARKRL